MLGHKRALAVEVAGPICHRTHRDSLACIGGMGMLPIVEMEEEMALRIVLGVLGVLGLGP